MPAEHVLLRQIIDSRKVICSLIWLHALQEFHCDRSVEPGDVPWTVVTLRQMVLEVELGNLLDHVVVGVLCIHDHTLFFICNIICVELLFVFIARREPVRVV